MSAGPIVYQCPVCNHPCTLSVEGQGARMAKCRNRYCHHRQVQLPHGLQWQPWFGAAAFATPVLLKMPPVEQPA